MATPLINPFLRFYTYSGTLANMPGGTLEFYKAGTVTPKEVFSDATGTVSLGAIVTLDGTGSAQAWLGTGGYKVVLKDAEGTTVDTADNVQGLSEVIQAGTIAAMRALEGGGSGYVNLGGYYVLGDDRLRHFYWDPTSVAADNGGTVIIPNSAPAQGRWIDLDRDAYSVKGFGAYADGVTDDSAAILAAFDAARAAGGGNIYFPKASYVISYGFLVPPNCNIYLNGSTFTATTTFGQSTPPTNGSANIFLAVTASATSVTLGEDYENVFIDGGGAVVNGNALNQVGTPTGTTGLSLEPTGGLALEANFLRVKNITVKNITFTYFVRYGCRIEGSETVLIENCRFLYSGTNGLSVIGAKDVTMRNVECSRTRGPYINDSNFGCGFWHEPNETWQTMENIVHENCFASYNYRAGFRLINPGQDTDAEIYARGCKSYRNSWDTATDDYWAVNDNAGFHVWIESSYTSNYHIEISDCTALEEYQSGFKVQRRTGEQTNSLVRLKNVSAIHCVQVDGDNYETAAISVVGTGSAPTQAARVEIDSPTIIAPPANTLGYLLGVSYSQDVYISNPRYSGPATYNGIFANIPSTRFSSGVPRMSIDVSADENTSGIGGVITEFYKPVRLASVDTTAEPTEFYSNELMVWQNDNDVLTGIYVNDDLIKKYIAMFDSIPSANQIIRGNTDGDGFSVSQATVDQPGNIQAGSNGDITVVGERFLNAYGVGVPGDTDFERANLNHDGANAILNSRAGGTGTARDWLIQKSGTTVLSIDSNGIILGASGPKVYYGSGTPESAITAPIGSTFHRTDGGAGTSFYVKESGSGNTGWVGK